MAGGLLILDGGEVALEPAERHGVGEEAGRRGCGQDEDDDKSSPSAAFTSVCITPGITCSVGSAIPSGVA